MSLTRLHSGPRMSQAVIHNQTVYLAGQVATGARGGSVTEQTKDVLANIDSLLAEANTDKTNILSATIWLTDMSLFADMNVVWEAWLAGGPTPARATATSPQLASSDFNVEIIVVAALP